jgi:hypothetical protein
MKKARLRRLPYEPLITILVLTLLATNLSSAAESPAYGHKDFVPSPQHPVGWRGDGSTGIFPGATPPTQWDSSGKGVLWRVTMPHQTLASPIVVKGKVITLNYSHFGGGGLKKAGIVRAKRHLLATGVTDSDVCRGRVVALLTETQYRKVTKTAFPSQFGIGISWWRYQGTVRLGVTGQASLGV